MSERKNIERLFQEKFKDFEATPDPQLWGNIASKLEKKENKKRVIPFWLKATGIAASLVLGYLALDTDTDGTQSKAVENNTEKVVSSESSEKETLPKNNHQNTTEENTNGSSTIANSSANPSENNAVVANETNENSKANQTSSNHSVETNKKGKENSAAPSLRYNTTNPIAVHKNSNKAKSTLSEGKDNAITPSYNETQSQSVAQVGKDATGKSSVKEKGLPKENTSLTPLNATSQSVAQVGKDKSGKSSIKGEGLPKENTSLTPLNGTSQSVAQVGKNTTGKSLVKEEGLPKENTSLTHLNGTSQSVAQVGKDKSGKSSIKGGGLPKENTSLTPLNSTSQSVVQVGKNTTGKSSIKEEGLPKENTSLDNSDKITQSVAQNANASDKKAAVNLTENANPIVNSSDNAPQKSFDASATNQSVNPLAILAKDSVAVAVEENALEKILKEKELQKKEEKAVAVVEYNPKWKIKPNVAPLFMNAPEGSPIDAQFSDNSKKFENKMSIGLGLDFALNSKISLRTGINQFDLGYNTNDIAFYADLNSKGPKQNGIKTINLRPDAQSMVVEDRKNNSSQELAIQNKETGYINQRMGYVEVPVEVSYKLLDRKFGVQFITGVSTLFLNDNQVSVVSSGLTTVLGEANNLNKVHFSTNIGLGFKYTFWKSFEANFEPTIKYQINTFNENSGGFKPYIIGLYSGVSFKF